MENTAAKHHMSTAQMTVTALMTAITCILAPMALPIPVSPVPISLTNLVIFFMAYILGTKLSVASYVLYLLLGTVGLPVFSGFSGGCRQASRTDRRISHRFYLPCSDRRLLR